ncbi:hypothetical protein GGR53DRAFT_479274 [Hypoxylon sp. FL1150]|nr:hypothetical protein GGR53DRAFT_479274 [Hypoxylon sp. FL1150]
MPLFSIPYFLFVCPVLSQFPATSTNHALGGNKTLLQFHTEASYVCAIRGFAVCFVAYVSQVVSSPRSRLRPVLGRGSLFVMAAIIGHNKQIFSMVINNPRDEGELTEVVVEALVRLRCRPNVERGYVNNSYYVFTS